MSSIIEAFYELKYNPFIYGHYIASFYASVEKSENNILLAPLVIPLCTHPIFGQKLNNSNIKSTIWSVFGDRAAFYDLQERINQFRFLTAQSIEYCLANDWLFIDEASLSLLPHSVTARRAFVNQKKAAKLARLFLGYTAVEIYAFLGVRFE